MSNEQKTSEDLIIEHIESYVDDKARWDRIFFLLTMPSEAGIVPHTLRMRLAEMADEIRERWMRDHRTK